MANEGGKARSVYAKFIFISNENRCRRYLTGKFIFLLWLPSFGHGENNIKWIITLDRRVAWLIGSRRAIFDSILNADHCFDLADIFFIRESAGVYFPWRYALKILLKQFWERRVKMIYICCVDNKGTTDLPTTWPISDHQAPSKLFLQCYLHGNEDPGTCVVSSGYRGYYSLPANMSFTVAVCNCCG